MYFETRPYLGQKGLRKMMLVATIKLFGATDCMPGHGILDIACTMVTGASEHK